MQINIQANDTKKLIENIREYYFKNGRDVEATEVLIEIRGGNKTTLKEITEICKEISKNYKEDSTVSLSTFFENEMDLKEVRITAK